VDLLKRFAEKKHAMPAQISLTWLLAQKPWIVPRHPQSGSPPRESGCAKCSAHAR